MDELVASGTSGRFWSRPVNVFYGDFVQLQIWKIRKSFSARHHFHSNNLMRSYYHANSHDENISRCFISSARPSKTQNIFAVRLSWFVCRFTPSSYLNLCEKSFWPRALAKKILGTEIPHVSISRQVGSFGKACEASDIVPERKVPWQRLWIVQWDHGMIR
jgi:hypothetical protein